LKLGFSDTFQLGFQLGFEKINEINIQFELRGRLPLFLSGVQLLLVLTFFIFQIPQGTLRGLQALFSISKLFLKHFFLIAAMIEQGF
jgi:hypothetical protein